MSFRQALLALLSLACVSQATFATTVYVRDTLYVPLRGGQSIEYRIVHKGLRSGTSLELIEQNDDTGYSRVRLDDGMEGWIQTQYLQDEPIAQDLLEATQEELRKLSAVHQQTLLRIQALDEESEAREAELETVRAQYQQTSSELEEITRLAASTISIEESNRALIAERDILEQQIDDLLIANDKLTDSSAQEWFVRGGAVVIVALILGFWASRRIYHRRASSWT